MERRGCLGAIILAEGHPTTTFEKVADTAKKLTDKDRKRKSEHAAKLQQNKARYISNDNSLNARMAYSR